MQHPAVVTLRTLLAAAATLLLTPLLAPALTQALPPCPPVRLYETLAARLLSVLASLAGVQMTIRPRDSLPAAAPYPSPLVRAWTSPLSPGRVVTTYDQPGRWMCASQLAHLQADLRYVADASIGETPSHRLFQGCAREVLACRIVCIVSDPLGPLAFTAMPYLPARRGVVVHLGLTMVAARARGQRLQSTLVSKALFVAVVNLARVSYYVTNCAASPAGIGNVCDYFFQCYPSYRGGVRREHHVSVARDVLARYRGEFGCSTLATFDERSFVVYASNRELGGGTHQFIRHGGDPVSRHRVEACNKMVDGLIDFAAGDELFQVATFNMFGSLVKYATSSKHWPRSRR